MAFIQESLFLVSLQRRMLSMTPLQFSQMGRQLLLWQKITHTFKCLWTLSQRQTSHVADVKAQQSICSARSVLHGINPRDLGNPPCDLRSYIIRATTLTTLSYNTQNCTLKTIFLNKKKQKKQ